MGRKLLVTPERVIAALQKHDGLQAAAARSLGVARSTISNYIKDNPEIAAAYESINEAKIDDVESSLFKAISSGNVIAQIFYLKTKAKHRGYVERQEITGKDAQPLSMEIGLRQIDYRTGLTPSESGPGGDSESSG